MTHSYGLNSKTRHTFARKFRQHGMINMHAYNTVYHIGDYVDIKGNGSIHRGMPHRQYVGKTGKVWNITPNAVGIEVNKKVGNRIIVKRINVRVEHIAPSRCREDFLKRVAANRAKKVQAKKDNKPIDGMFLFPLFSFLNYFDSFLLSLYYYYF